MMLSRHPGLASAFVFALGMAVLPSPAQHPVAPDSGCVQQKGSYVCNWSNFKLAFDQARTIAIQTEPLDRSTARQVSTLITGLGKTQVAEGNAADLTMLLIPIEPTGVNIGPMDHDLATLRIYAPAEGKARGTLLWAETLKGQGDRPWPAQVHALVAQFQGRFPSGR